MNWELLDVQAGFRKGRGIRDQVANICWIIEKAREFQKNIYSALLTTLKTLTVWLTTNCEKFFKRWEYQTTLSASWETCMQVNAWSQHGSSHPWQRSCGEDLTCKGESELEGPPWTYLSIYPQTKICLFYYFTTFTNSSDINGGLSPTTFLRKKINLKL